MISISQATANRLPVKEGARKIALRVYGSSGWDRDAFLMPGVDLAFDTIKYTNFPVVVLNLNAPSALLGFQLGGIVGPQVPERLPRRHRSRAARPPAQSDFVNANDSTQSTPRTRSKRLRSVLC